MFANLAADLSAILPRSRYNYYVHGGYVPLPADINAIAWFYDYFKIYSDYPLCNLVYRVCECITCSE